MESEFIKMYKGVLHCTVSEMENMLYMEMGQSTEPFQVMVLKVGPRSRAMFCWWKNSEINIQNIIGVLFSLAFRVLTQGREGYKSPY